MQPVPIHPAPAHGGQTQACELLLLDNGHSTPLWWFFFPSYAALWDFKAPHWPNLWEGFLLCGNFSTFMTPSPGWVSVLKSFVSLSVFIFCPTSFWRDWFAFLGIWDCPPAFRSYSVEVVPHTDDLSMYLWGESGRLILFLHHLGTTCPSPCILH